MGLSQFDEKYPYATYFNLDDALGTGWRPLDPTDHPVAHRCDVLIAVSSAAGDVLLTLIIQDSAASPGATEACWTVTLPAGAGNGTVAAVDVLGAVGTPVAGGFALTPNKCLFARLGAALDPGEVVTLTYLGGEL